MKRVAVWAFYGIGALAILYLALYAYVAVTGRGPQPGDPIHIFRKPDAPDYSWRSVIIPASFRGDDNGSGPPDHPGMTESGLRRRSSQ